MNNKEEQGSIGDIEFMQYDLATLKSATRDFSEENKLGEGGFGIVYKGTLENGHQLAIKRLSDTSRQGTKEFMAESRFLAKLQHKNLVSLVGFCSEGDEKLLVYEFMPNSSLDRFLFDPRKRPLLDWATRNKIIMGIARGLQYLHEDSRLTIIHRDLKPSNVLLDKDMNPNIADFGMAKLFEVEQKYGQTNRIIGTQGYMAPEYLMTGEYSDKSDVYSFGIMLLEIVSGQKNRLLNMSPRNEDLPLHAWKLWKEGRCFDIADPALYNIYSSSDVIRCIQIGLLCVQVNPEQRPAMPYVVLMLSGLIDLPLPLAPTLSSHQFSMTNSYSGDPQTDSDQPSGKTARRLWDEGRSIDLTDPALLYNNSSNNDVIRCIQIGLLCVQAIAEQRPAMTSVVLMLTGSIDLPLPLAPSTSFHQFGISNSHSSNPQTDSDQLSVKTVTWQTEPNQDLYPQPR
ncbi:cysteine-rich receptor-like protein kinase 44 [Silene latifolia]|uniref:cysteine-rich receptor-like protein kinase 44 n=1 Tax=Silene latifolia TaxID=37657 RepID=UPI003D76BA26